MTMLNASALASEPSPGQGRVRSGRASREDGKSSTAPQQPQPPTKTPRTAPSLRLLIVEDNIDAADSLSLLLQYVGHEVAVAHTGPAALEAARDVQPNVVLLDIGLPGMEAIKWPSSYARMRT